MDCNSFGRAAVRPYDVLALLKKTLPSGSARLRVYSKNFTSLLANERFDLLVEDLRNFEWDVVMCQET